MAGSGEKRVALVIGNSNYKNAGKLRNPENDARAIALALTRLGFQDATARLDLDNNKLRDALRRFSKAADNADMAVLYFAGHGVEIDGKNFIIPVDAQLSRADDAPFVTTPLDLVLHAVRNARVLRLIILDACRNNPFKDRLLRANGARSINSGLGSIEPSSNTLVAYAAKHGFTAADGAGANSPYAEALLAHIEKPGLELGKLFREVHHDVIERTSGQQEPWTYGALGRDDIYLVPATPPILSEKPKETSAASLELSPPLPPSSRPLGSILVVSGLALSVIAIAAAWWLRAELPQCSALEWERAEKRQSIGGFQKIAADCRETTHGIYAREELEKRDKADWDEARKVDTPDSYRGYLDRWENQKPYRGRYIPDAQAAMKSDGSTKPSGQDNTVEKARQEAERAVTQDDAAFAAAKQTGTKAALTDYLQRYPQGRNMAAARAELARLGLVEEAVDAARGKTAGGVFRDCWQDGGKQVCGPQMVVIPSAEFLMGSPENEPGRFSDEGPQHKVTIRRAFAVGRTHVTRGEFAAFVKATNHKVEESCNAWTGSEWKNDGSRSWQSPGFDQGDDHPVVCVNWNDAVAYTNWMSSATGKSYRLMSEAEAEYVARGIREAKPQPRYFFGNDEKDLCRYANGADQTGKVKFPNWTGANPCEDGYVFTAPVATYKPNAFGVYDVHGNAWSWTQDCWRDSYKDKPEALKANGGALTTEGCSPRVVRGGSWSGSPRSLRSASRSGYVPGYRIFNLGFRVARTLTP